MPEILTKRSILPDVFPGAAPARLRSGRCAKSPVCRLNHDKPPAGSNRRIAEWGHRGALLSPATLALVIVNAAPFAVPLDIHHGDLAGVADRVSFVFPLHGFGVGQ